MIFVKVHLSNDQHYFFRSVEYDREYLIRKLLLLEKKDNFLNMTRQDNALFGVLYNPIKYIDFIQII